MTELQGTDKATALLLTMGKQQADRIVKQFDDSEIRSLANSATNLPPVHSEHLKQILDELDTQLALPTPLTGSLQSARELLTGVINDETVGAIIGERTDPTERIWQKAEVVPDSQVIDFIHSEHPQVAAYTLSKLTAQKSAAIMEQLGEDLRADLCARLLNIKEVRQSANNIIARHLANAIANKSNSTSKDNAYPRLGAILSELDIRTAEGIISRVCQQNSELERQLRKYVLSFDNIALLSLEDRAALFEEIELEKIIAALRGSQPTLVSKILAALSPRAKRTVEGELARDNKENPKSTSIARRYITQKALTMADDGQICFQTNIDSQPLV